METSASSRFCRSAPTRCDSKRSEFDKELDREFVDDSMEFVDDSMEFVDDSMEFGKESSDSNE